MLSADHPDPRSDAGFVRAYDAQAARRQFQISIVLVAVLVIAAIALGTLARIDRPAASGRTSDATARSQPFRGNFTGHSRLIRENCPIRSLVVLGEPKTVGPRRRRGPYRFQQVVTPPRGNEFFRHPN